MKEEKTHVAKYYSPPNFFWATLPNFLFEKKYAKLPSPFLLNLAFSQ